MRHLGEISRIHRYPVKSFQGESLLRTEVGMFGLPGDRMHVFVEPAKGDRHLSAKQRPALLGYSAVYEGGQTGDSAAVQVTSPEGELFRWDESLLDEIARITELNLSLMSFSVNHEGLAAVDAEPILITTEASLTLLQELHGLSIDIRRFRPNLVLRSESLAPFEELGWIGSRLLIGDVELRVIKGCGRCSMVNVDPDHLDYDPSLLTLLAKQFDGCFGVYAQVIRTGSLGVQDQVVMMAEKEEMNRFASAGH